MLCALIMAGGRGTRFWPQSTEEKPKQFLNLLGNKTMIQMTYERIMKVVPNDRIFVITNNQYDDLVVEQLPDLPKRNIIMEPVGRNTAPCILLASLYIKQIYNDANIVVLPSDHVINNVREFCDVICTADEYLDKNEDAIITIGIKPNRPETGYGYIKCSNKYVEQNRESIIKVEKFVEKPDLIKATQYLKEGNYLWNAGIFIFNLNYMLVEMKNNCGKSYELLSKLPSIESKEYDKVLNVTYDKCENISIDYAIMEKSQSVYVIPSNFGWDDIGTWISLQRYIKPDEEKNIIKGNVKTYNSSNNVVYAGDKKIILIDINDIFCIESDDVIIIGKKEQLSNIHEYKNIK